MKRILCLLPAIIFTLIFFASCSNENGVKTENNKNDPGETASDEATAPENEEPDPADIEELPEKDFGGRTFTFLSYGDGTMNTWSTPDIVKESENGEPVNDAVYRRNRQTEERFGIEIKAQYNGTSGLVERTFKSGDNAFDAVWLDMNGLGICAQNRYLADLKELPCLDLKKKYWDQSVTRDLSVGGKVYFAAGDISIGDKWSTWVMMFNKNMVRDNNLENIYELVKSGGWTIDKFSQMIKDVSKDLDGNGIWDNKDQYGFTTTNDTIYGFYYGCGETPVKKSNSDLLEYSYKSGGADKLQKIAEITVEILKKEDNTLIVNNGKYTWQEGMYLFLEDRALFYSEVMVQIERLRVMETDFGIIPLPKFDKNQKDYVTFVHPAGGLLGVLSNHEDREFAGIILEATAAESSRTLRPAYYDITLKRKGARDVESEQMLDIIIQNRAFDPGIIFNLGNVMNSYYNMAAKGEANVSSMLEKQIEKMEKDINDFNDKFMQ